MWKSLLLGLLVSLHTRIFLVFMRNYEAKSPLFMIKRAGLNYVPRQSYSKNSHGSYILKWILVDSLTTLTLDRETSNEDASNALNKKHSSRILSDKSESNF